MSLSTKIILAMAPGIAAGLLFAIGGFPALSSVTASNEYTEDQTIQKLYDHWILGKSAQKKKPRWCVLRDVLGWVD